MLPGALSWVLPELGSAAWGWVTPGVPGLPLALPQPLAMTPYSLKSLGEAVMLPLQRTGQD